MMPPKTGKNDASLMWFLVRDDKSKEHYARHQRRESSESNKEETEDWRFCPFLGYG